MTDKELLAQLQWYDGGSPMQLEVAREYYGAMIRGEEAIKKLAEKYEGTAKAGGLLQLEVMRLMVELQEVFSKRKLRAIPKAPYAAQLKTLYSACVKYKAKEREGFPGSYEDFAQEPIILFAEVFVYDAIDELIKETPGATWERLQEIRQLTEALAVIRRALESPGEFDTTPVIKDTRALARVNTTKQGNEKGGALEVKLKDGATFALENYKELKRSFTPRTMKYFTIAITQHAKQSKLTPTGTIKNMVEIKLEDIAAQLKRSTSPRSIKRLQEDLLDEFATIRGTTIRGKGYVTGYVRKAETKGGYLRILFEDEFAAALASAKVFTRIPRWLYAADSVHAFPLGAALALYYFDNGNTARKHNDIISIERCINYAGLYDREYVAKEFQSAYKRYIQGPLIKALEELRALSAGGFTWEYMTKKGRAWEQLPREDAEALPFTEWHALSIRFKFLGTDGAPQLPPEKE